MTIGKCVLLVAIVIGLTNRGSTYAQYENIWAFGYHAGLDFNSGTPIPIRTSIYTNEGSATICDANGQLLFYTDGSTVYNRNHDTMPNGDVLRDSIAWAVNGGSTTSSTHQGAAIVPDPNDRYRYYLFSLQTRTDVYNTGRLSYSVVDMTLDNGLGDVVIGEKDVYLDTLLNEQMTVIPGKNCDVWLLVSEFTDKQDKLTVALGYANRHYRIKAYHIDQNGVNVIPVLTDSLPLNLPPEWQYMPRYLMGLPMSGVVSFTVSNDYTKLVDNRGRLTLYDFDRLSGKVSNPVSDFSMPVSDSSDVWWSSCFSPDDSKLYAIGGIGYKFVQFDIHSLNPVVIDPNPVRLNIMYTDTVWAQRVDTFRVGRIKMGPDKKLYFTHTNPLARLLGFGGTTGHLLTDYIGRINAPNETFPLCDIQFSQFDTAFKLLHSTSAVGSIPNNQIEHPWPKDTSIVRNYTFLNCSTTFLSPSYRGGWGYRWGDGQTAIGRQVDSVGVYAVSYYSTNGYCSIQIDSFFVSEVLSCYNGITGWAYVNRHPSDPNQYSYIWMNASQETISNADTLRGVPAGKYYVSVRSAQDTTLVCFTIDEIIENVSFDPSALIACQGDTLDFTNTSSPYYTAFEWQENMERLSDVFHLRHTFPDAGSYDIRLIGRGKVCMDTFSKTIIVDSMLPGAFQVDLNEICVGRPVSFYPLVDSSTKGVQWSFSDAASREETSKTSEYQHAFDRAGVILITMYAQFRACPGTIYTDSIRVYPLPEVDLGSDSSICLHGAPVYLKNQREAPLDPHHYLWNTGDTTAILKVVHPGTYSLSVSTEPIGCTTTESVEITKDCYIDIPNAFSPNGDGHNDYFFPRQLLSESVDRFRMQVFNRWGQIVFETTKPDGRGWDGRFNGNDQPVGVYVYRIEVDFGEDRRQEQYEGNVTLIR